MRLVLVIRVSETVDVERNAISGRKALNHPGVHLRKPWMWIRAEILNLRSSCEAEPKTLEMRWCTEVRWSACEEEL